MHKESSNITAEELRTLATSVNGLAAKVAIFIASQVEKVTTTDIEEKDLNSLVSYVDKEAEIQLVKGLQKLQPNASFITEEATVQNSQSEEVWIIDPLDGTNNFLHRIPHFAISIALQVHGNVVYGVVYDVMKTECFHAIKDEGAYLNNAPIATSKTATLSDAFLATGFPYNNSYDEKPMMDTLVHWLKHTRGIRRMGAAALDLAYVACGRFDAYYETTLNIWDVAAGNLIVAEAGGTVSDYTDGQKHTTGQEVLASNGHLHTEIKKIIISKYNSILT